LMTLSEGGRPGDWARLCDRLGGRADSIEPRANVAVSRAIALFVAALI
jgi:hypothetical protein